MVLVEIGVYAFTKRDEKREEICSKITKRTPITAYGGVISAAGKDLEIKSYDVDIQQVRSLPLEGKVPSLRGR